MKGDLKDRLASHSRRLIYANRRSEAVDWMATADDLLGESLVAIADLEAERDALQAKLKQNDTACINGWNDAHRAIAAKEQS